MKKKSYAGRAGEEANDVEDGDCPRLIEGLMIEAVGRIGREKGCP